MATDVSEPLINCLITDTGGSVLRSEEGRKMDPNIKTKWDNWEY